MSCVVKIPWVHALYGGTDLYDRLGAHALDWERDCSQIELALIQLFANHFYDLYAWCTMSFKKVTVQESKSAFLVKFVLAFVIVGIFVWHPLFRFLNQSSVVIIKNRVSVIVVIFRRFELLDLINSLPRWGHCLGRTGRWFIASLSTIWGLVTISLLGFEHGCGEFEVVSVTLYTL